VVDEQGVIQPNRLDEFQAGCNPGFLRQVIALATGAVAEFAR
jgi:hypothetical protein